MKSIKSPLLCMLLILRATCGMAQFDYTNDFKSLIPDTFLHFARNDSNFDYALNGSSLHFTKAAGATSGKIELETRFLLTGDFSVSVQGTRGVGVISTGLAMRTADGKALDIYFTSDIGGRPYILSNITTPPSGNYVTNSTVIFWLTRSSGTVRAEYEINDGRHQLLTLANATEAATITLFFSQEGNPSAAAAAQADFNDFKLHADGFIDQRAVLTSSISRAVKVSWVSDLHTRYEVQYSDSPTSTEWRTLGSPLLGTGATLYVFDEASNPQRIYRVAESQ